jgi:hypothetical protein
MIILTNPWSWGLLEKLPVAQLLKNSSTSYGTRTSISVFTRACPWSQSSARLIYSISPCPVPVRCILLLSSHPRLGLPGGLFHSGSHEKPVRIPLLPMCASCTAHLILLDLNILLIINKYKISQYCTPLLLFLSVPDLPGYIDCFHLLSFVNCCEDTTDSVTLRWCDWRAEVKCDWGIVTCMCDHRRGLDWWMDLLAI